MRYQTAGAFRKALEHRLLENQRRSGTPLDRLRKLVAFDRYLARLADDDPERWLLKGGLALQLRLGDRARTTKDIDARLAGDLADAGALLARAGGLDLGDWFEFEIGQPTEEGTEGEVRGARFPVHCLLDARTFERFHVDVSSGDPVLDEPELLTGPPILEFAGVSPASVRCYPLPAQIAEKLHAYSREYAGRKSTRLRDLIDILLIGSGSRLDGRRLRDAIDETFHSRGTHPVPVSLPDPPDAWSRAYGAEADELDLAWESLEQATGAARGFLNPVLGDRTVGVWNPRTWAWEVGQE